MAANSSTLAWKIPWTEEPGRLQSMRLLRVGHNWGTSLSLSCAGEGNGSPLQCSCLENPRDGEPGGLPSMGSRSRTRLKWLSNLANHIYPLSLMGLHSRGWETFSVSFVIQMVAMWTFWRKKWQPTPVFLPEESHGQRSLGATVCEIRNSQTPLSDCACGHCSTKWYGSRVH